MVLQVKGDKKQDGLESKWMILRIKVGTFIPMDRPVYFRSIIQFIPFEPSIFVDRSLSQTVYFRGPSDFADRPL